MELEDNAPPVTGKAQPWVEKYRPDSVDEVAHQEEVTKTLKKAIETGKVPHLLLYGPPGTGKTSTILALAKNLYGKEGYKSRILELNASDERGIKVIREKVKRFAQLTVTKLDPVNGVPVPPFKIIILDEADTMTTDAQAALRRTMENYSKITRFCLVCNYVTRIIEPLASRCAKFRYTPLSNDAMTQRLNFIAHKEEVSATPNIIEAIIETAGGDMRKAVNTLQSIHLYYGDKLKHFGSQSSSENNTESQIVNEIKEMAGDVPDYVLENLYRGINSECFDTLKKEVDDAMLEGFPVASILNRYLDHIINCDTISDVKKAIIVERIAIADKCILDGAAEYLQLLDLLALAMRTIHSE